MDNKDNNSYIGGSIFGVDVSSMMSSWKKLLKEEKKQNQQISTMLDSERAKNEQKREMTVLILGMFVFCFDFGCFMLCFCCFC